MTSAGVRQFKRLFPALPQDRVSLSPQQLIRLPFFHDIPPVGVEHVKLAVSKMKSGIATPRRCNRIIHFALGTMEKYWRRCPYVCSKLSSVVLRKLIFTQSANSFAVKIAGCRLSDFIVNRFVELFAHNIFRFRVTRVNAS